MEITTPRFALTDRSGTTAGETHFQQGTAISIEDPIPKYHIYQLIMILPQETAAKLTAAF